MTRQVLIPLVSMDSGEVDSFLELRLAPGLPKQRDCFAALEHGILKTAVCKARLALESFPLTDLDGSIYLVNSQVALSSTHGAAFALALCPLLMQPQFPFNRSLVIGKLEFPEMSGGGIQIAADRFIVKKLQAVLQLAYQTEPLLLVIPPLPVEIHATDFYQSLAAKNIAVRTVATLEAAYKAVSL